MMENPLISVIVPIYNVEKYLERCVNSIINQTYQNLEIILVDDGSPDNCGKICDEYAKIDSRIKVIHKENEGQSKARNDGLDIASGKYITFVDSDDWLELDTYNWFVTAIKDNDIAICGHRTVSKECEIVVDIFEDKFLDNEALWEEVLGKLNNAVWNKLFKAELLKDIRFSTEILHGEDLFFTLEYIKKCKSGVINKTPKYNYFKHSGSITSSSFSHRRFMEITSKDKVLAFVKKENPNFINTALKYCFRARMNVLRAIYISNLQNDYSKEIKDIKEYLNSNYRIVFKSLKSKEKIEYFIFKNFNILYKSLVKKIRKVF